ncbi:MAG: hypothetical protein A2X56_08300 [Nitrospirae bacterium GWC2_57_13]|jgi:hypothetical protein|nr:MAG: hypothetical protein A2X56_08300 [Nitrospirae bacterium GWC2_57_13]OGW44392.1 MAG: hypothetical protein A2X57_07140 [Nitrospirae bacterium GWD2_57_8]
MVKSQRSKSTYPVLIAVFCASLASLAYEITLTRFFSISLSYHFAFMVISIALLGIGAAGTALFLLPSGKDLRLLPHYSIMLALAIPLSALLVRVVPFDPARISFDGTQILFIGLIALILSTPFFFFGLTVLTVFSLLSKKSGTIYAADLIGAAAGSLVVLLLLSAGGPGTAVLLLAFPPLAAAYFIADRTGRIVSAVLAMSIAAVLVIAPDMAGPAISPYKPLATALRFPGAEVLQTTYSPYSRVDLFTGAAARFAPGLSLRYLDPLPRQTGLSVDAADLNAITHRAEKDDLAFLDHLPSMLVYRLSKGPEVLVMDPRGGLQVLVAGRHGPRNITAMESNPHIAGVVRSYLGKEDSFLPGNQWSKGLGRTILSSRDTRYDSIDLSFTGSFPTGSFGFAEDYRYTVEAFRTYMERLKPGGFLSLTLYLLPPPRTEFRLFNTISAAAESLGIKDITEHTAVIRSWGTVTILFKRAPFSSIDIRTIKDFCRDLRFDMVLYPGISEADSNIYVRMPENSYFQAFRRLADTGSREQFIEAYLFDIRPVTDERPFFHYYLRLNTIRETFQVMGERWEYFFEEGYLLPVLFLQVLLVSLLLIILPLLRKRSLNAGHYHRQTAAALAYFACLGLAFLFVEIALIQKMVLALETPQYAMSAVILAVLASSGAGSLLSERLPWLRDPRTLAVLALLVAASAFVLPAAVRVMAPLPFGAKYMLVFLLIMPTGILLGIPFPAGIVLLGRTRPDLLPWAWAVNGCFSVLSPILALMIALAAGFSTVLFLASALYLVAALLLRTMYQRAGA